MAVWDWPIATNSVPFSDVAIIETTETVQINLSLSRHQETTAKRWLRASLFRVQRGWAYESQATLQNLEIPFNSTTYNELQTGDGAIGASLFFFLYKFKELLQREINGSEIVCPETDGLVDSEPELPTSNLNKHTFGREERRVHVHQKLDYFMMVPLSLGVEPQFHVPVRDVGDRLAKKENALFYDAVLTTNKLLILPFMKSTYHLRAWIERYQTQFPHSHKLKWESKKATVSERYTTALHPSNRDGDRANTLKRIRFRRPNGRRPSTPLGKGQTERPNIDWNNTTLKNDQNTHHK
ncbi:hypothetical protein CBL_01260 [Carabus blaptoides fortunei]